MTTSRRTGRLGCLALCSKSPRVSRCAAAASLVVVACLHLATSPGRPVGKPDSLVRQVPAPFGGLLGLLRLLDRIGAVLFGRLCHA